MEHYENMQQVRNAHRIWFSPDTMKFFRSIVETDLVKGQYFITSERQKNEENKKYTIRHADHNVIKTIGKFQQYTSLAEAEKALNDIIESEENETVQGKKAEV